MRTLALLLITAALPCIAQAELVVRAGESVTPEQQGRFYPIAGYRNGNPTGASSVKRDMHTPAQRSDSAAMANGYFRIDRSRTVATVVPPLVVRVPAAEQSKSDMPRIIYGGQQHQETATPANITAASQLSLPNIRSTAADGLMGTAGSAPILSLFDNAENNQAASFRDALSAGTPGSQQPVTMPHQWPVQQSAAQKLSSNYGFRASPFNSNTQFHGGIDIASPIGTPVLASADGVVTSVGNESGYGKTIVLQHPDGSESRYSHLNTDSVAQGQNVRGGQMIATVGTSGHSTGPHLDYRLSKEGVSIDPLKVLTANAASQAATPPATKRSTVIRPTQTASRERVILVQ